MENKDDPRPQFNCWEIWKMSNPARFSNRTLSGCNRLSHLNADQENFNS